MRLGIDLQGKAGVMHGFMKANGGHHIVQRLA